MSASSSSAVMPTSSFAAEEQLYKAKLQVPLPTAEGAHMMMLALQVDEALPGTSRNFYQLPEARHVLCVRISSANPRSLRMALHSIQEQIDLACRTLEAFAHTAVGGGVAPGSNASTTHKPGMLMPSPTLKPAGRGVPPPISGISL